MLITGVVKSHLAAAGSVAPASILPVHSSGGNTGIGYETAKALAAQGLQTVIACRDSDKAAAAKQRIRYLCA